MPTLCAVLLVPVLLGATQSQESTASDEPVPEPETYRLADTVIKGELIDRSFVDTITSVSSLDQEEIEERPGNPNLDEVLRTLPNVGVTDGQITVRGINNFGDGDNPSPLISTTVDGAWISPDTSRRAWLPMQLWDVETVEVLRGPQSTENGPNSAAGAIVLRTVDPTWEQEGRLRVGVGSYDTWQTAFANGGPLIDDYLAYRIAVDYRESNGFIEDAIGRDDYGEFDYRQLRGKLLWQPNGDDTLQVKLTLDNTAGTSNNQNVNDFTADPEDRRPEPAREGLGNPEIDSDTNRAIVDVDGLMGDAWRFSSTTAVSTFEADASFEPIGLPDDFMYEDEAITQQLAFYYETEELDAVVGLYAGRFRDEFEGTQLGGGILFDEQETRTTFAIFSSADYRMSDAWTLTGGVRVEYEEFDVENDTVLGLDPPLGAEESVDNTVLLPRIGVRYNPRGDLTFGAQVSRGYRGGGTTFDIFNFEGVEAFDPEFLWNYELSMRDTLLDGRFAYGLNLFFTDWQDKQVSFATSPFLPVLTTNAGEAESYGAEVTMQYSPDALPGLAFDLAAGIVETEYKSFFVGANDFSGNEFNPTPDWNGSLGVNYASPGGYFGGVRVTRIGGGFEDPANTRSIFGYTTLDARAGYRWEGGEVELFARNLLDEFGLVRNASFFVVPNAPEFYGVNVSLRW
ncbi:MAG: TonB-dependent receptor [Planctomycetota bacterium]